MSVPILRPFLALLASSGALASYAAAQVTWTLAADQTSATTRSLRGCALATTSSTVYGTFIQGSSTSGARRYTLAGLPPAGTPAEFFNVTTQPHASSDSHQAEAVVVDDRGLVIVASNKDSTSADNARIYVCASDFSAPTKFALADIDVVGTLGETIGGIDFRKVGATRYLYVSRFRAAGASPYVERHVLGGTGSLDATLTLDTTFNGTGRFSVPGASKLRGIDVGPDGTMYIASRDTNTVWRVPDSLTGITSATITRAMDCAVFDGRVFVTSYDAAASQVTELDAATLAPTGRTFTATGTFPRGAAEGYAGIDLDAQGHLFVCDQFYGTNMDRILVSSPVCRPNLYETYGAGCSGASPNTPNIEAAFGSVPKINATFNVDVTGMPPGGGMYWMLFGLRTDEFDGIPLPVDLAIIGVTGGCLLRTEIEFVEGFVQAGGSAVYSLSIPLNLDLVGRSFYHQALVASPTANPLGLTISNAKHACIDD